MTFTQTSARRPRRARAVVGPVAVARASWLARPQVAQEYDYELIAAPLDLEIVLASAVRRWPMAASAPAWSCGRSRASGCGALHQQAGRTDHHPLARHPPADRDGRRTVHFQPPVQPGELHLPVQDPGRRQLLVPPAPDEQRAARPRAGRPADHRGARTHRVPPRRFSA